MNKDRITTSGKNGGKASGYLIFLLALIGLVMMSIIAFYFYSIFN